MSTPSSDDSLSAKEVDFFQEYQCVYCGKMFDQESSLSEHLVIVHHESRDEQQASEWPGNKLQRLISFTGSLGCCHNFFTQRDFLILRFRSHLSLKPEPDPIKKMLVLSSNANFNQLDQLDQSRDNQAA